MADEAFVSQANSVEMVGVTAERQVPTLVPLATSSTDHSDPQKRHSLAQSTREVVQRERTLVAGRRSDPQSAPGHH